MVLRGEWDTERVIAADPRGNKNILLEWKDLIKVGVFVEAEEKYAPYLSRIAEFLCPWSK